MCYAHQAAFDVISSLLGTEVDHSTGPYSGTGSENPQDVPLVPKGHALPEVQSPDDP